MSAVYRHISQDIHHLGTKIDHLLHDKGFWIGFITLAAVAVVFILLVILAAGGNISEVPNSQGPPFYP